MLKLPAAKHTKKASVGVDIVTATDILHKIQQWVRKACYNANTDSYALSTHQPHDAFVHTLLKNMLLKNRQTIFRHNSCGTSSLTEFCTIKTLILHNLSHQASSEATRCYLWLDLDLFGIY